MPAPLRIQLLGRFEVWRGNTPIPPAEWRGQKPRDLLKILLLARGKFVSNDQLCEWLWPGVEPESAQINMRSAVSDLRKLLERELAHGRDSAFILTKREGYTFNLTVWAEVDIFDFEKAITATSRPELESALALYDSDLLEEDPYAEWASRERERLRDLRLDALARLARICLDGADYPRAIALCEQALAFDASRETLWRALMGAYLRNGDRAAALRAFERCRAALARDLGVDPLPETMKLHEETLQDPHPSIFSHESRGVLQERKRIAQRSIWLYRLGAAGIVIWVVVTATSLGLSLAGLLRGTFVSSGDPGGEALPYLLAYPEALDEINQQLYLFFPFGLLLLPGYIAWFAALRSEQSANAFVWVGLVLGVIDVTAQTLSRAVGLVQLTVLPPPFAVATPDQQLVLITLWDILRQFASIFGIISGIAGPVAVSVLCWVSQKRFPRLLVWGGMGLALLTLLYSFLPFALLPLGLGLTFATYAWFGWLAIALWQFDPSSTPSLEREA